MRMTSLISAAVVFGFAPAVTIAAPAKDVRPLEQSVGGLIKIPAKGNFVIISSQEKYSDVVLTNLIGVYSRQFKFPLKLEKSKKAFDVFGAAECMSATKANVAVFLVQDDKLPMSLVSMEQHWVMVNASKVYDGSVDAKKNQRRLQREMSRAFKALLSSGMTAKNAKAVSEKGDLDGVSRDPIDAKSLYEIIRGLPSFGLTPASMTTYQRACEEGWAFAPTNEYQRAIWDKVHAAPTKPIVIKPETKKQ